MNFDGLAKRGKIAAEEFIQNGVETWQKDGRITADQGQRLLQSLNTPRVEAALLHLGVHFAISVPLRSPFGSIARFGYTLVLRVRAELVSLLGRGPPNEARKTHTMLVMAVALLPGFGRLGYFFSPALREERLLLFVPLDIVARKLPFHLYERFHLEALFVYWALGDHAERRGRGFLRSTRDRLAALKPYSAAILVVLALDSVLLIAGAYLYLQSDRDPAHRIWWFREGGLMSIVDVAQLTLGAIFGIAAYRAFWRRDEHNSRSEAAGIFLWGIGGIGLAVFALDDFFEVHERAGTYIFETLGFLPVVTNFASDMLVLAYAAVGIVVILVFRMELFSGRPSATLLQLAAASSIVMVVVDGFARTDAIKALEFPAQTYAASLLMLAFAVRWIEVQRLSLERHRSCVFETSSPQ